MERLNIAELLKDCPKGMELDCTMFDGVYFDHVNDLGVNKIKCYVNNDNEHFEIALNKYGQYVSYNSAKCVIFPKGKTTWEGFHRPFKDGDIILTHTTDYTWASIFKQFSENSCCTYVDLCINNNGLFSAPRLCDMGEIKRQRLATKDEKEKLFDAIKANGYKWDEENKTLEKLIEPLIEPKFKIGDKIRHKNDKTIIKTITCVYYDSYALCDSHILLFADQDMWELVLNKFDINTLVPFESRVLIRDTKLQKWSPAIWGFYDSDSQDYQYKLVGVIARYCIPYKGNEHLLGTTDDCNEYFKTWE